MKSERIRLIKKLDTMWSLKVRERYRKCVMCGSNSNLNAHHCICRKAQGLGVRWLLDNSVCLCVGCHIFKLHGQQADKAWLDRYIEVVNSLIPKEKQEEIQRIGHKTTKYSIEDLKELIEKFKKEK